MAKFLIKSDLPISDQRKIDALELIPSAQRTVSQAAYLTALAPYRTNLIISIGEDALITVASGLTVPTGTSGFRKGAIFIKTDASGNGEYMNTANETSAAWDLVDQATTTNIDDLAVTTAKINNLAVTSGKLADAAITEKILLGGTFQFGNPTGNVLGKVWTFRDNGSTLTLGGRDYTGTLVQTYGGIYYDIVFGKTTIGGHGVGNLHTRMIIGSNTLADMEFQTSNCLLLSAIDDGDTPTDVEGKIQLNARAGVIFNLRAVGDVVSPQQLTIDRVDETTVGVSNTSGVKLTTTSGNLVMNGVIMLSGDITSASVGSAAIKSAAVTGVKVATNLMISFSGVGANASGGATNATVTGVKVGDILLMAFNLTDLTDDTARFAATANGNGTISQLNTDLSAKTLRFLFLSQQA